MNPRSPATIFDCLMTAIAVTAALTFIQKTVSQESAPSPIFYTASDSAITAAVPHAGRTEPMLPNLDKHFERRVSN